MNRLVVLSALVIAIFAVVAMSRAGSQVTWADVSRSQEVVVMLADGDAMRHPGQSVDLTMSLFGLIATLQEDQPFIFIDSEDPSNALGPFRATDPDFKSVQDAIEARLRSPRLPDSGGLAEALAETHSRLTGDRAAIGSSLYVITGRATHTDFGMLSRGIVPLVSRFAKSGWPINGISLPDATPESLEFLDTLSKNSGGQLFELTVSDGFTKLANDILTRGSRGSLATVGKRVLTSNEVMSSVVTVAPGTRETTLLFFKESPSGSLRLSNPSGFEVSASDRSASSVMESPHVVIWKLMDPAPGNWKIDARGMEGLISAWEYSINKYSVILGTSGPAPINEPTTMVAYVTDGEKVVALDAVRLFARVTTPEGATLVHEMMDDGVKGDDTAGDGYFTMTIPQLNVEGDYQVELELTWTDYNHRISSYATFEAQAFPAIEVRLEQLQGLIVGERTKVATVFVHVQGEPYPVPAGQLAASLASPADQEGLLELEPHRLFGQGPAWEYDVFFTPNGEGFYTQVFQLSLEYSGRPYTQSSDSIVLSSVMPAAAPVESVPEPEAPAPAPAPAPQLALPPPVAMAEPESSGFPWLALALPMVLLIGAAGGAVYLLTRALPYGYLFNDKGESLVDFAKVKRHPVLKVLFRGLVRGSDLNVPGLEGLVFHFSKRGITLRNLRRQPTVRVDNEPLIGQATIGDQTWIGTHGKLFNFVLSPSTTSMEGASAD